MKKKFNWFVALFFAASVLLSVVCTITVPEDGDVTPPSDVQSFFAEEITFLTVFKNLSVSRPKSSNIRLKILSLSFSS